MSTSHFPDPQPAWWRLWKRIEGELTVPSRENVCTVAEKVERTLEWDLATAIAKRDFREIDRVSDEFAELGRFGPLCPRIAVARPIREYVEALRAQAGGG